MSNLLVASLRLPLEVALLPKCYVNTKSASTVSALLITAVRVPIALLGVFLAATGDGLLAMVMFTLFAFLDVIDGIAARSVGADTASRRIADVVIDRLAIHAAFVAACYATGSSWQAWSLLLVRDVVQGIFSLCYIHRTGIVVIGAHWHMSYGLAMLGTVGCILLLGGLPSFAFVLAAAVSIATLLDYFRGSLAIEAFYPHQR